MWDTPTSACRVRIVCNAVMQVRLLIYGAKNILFQHLFSSFALITLIPSSGLLIDVITLKNPLYDFVYLYSSSPSVTLYIFVALNTSLPCPHVMMSSMWEGTPAQRLISRG